LIESVRSRSTTLTEAAVQELQHAIQNGVYPPGSQLPSEAELTKLLGISRVTVREALRRMEERGIILRRHGAGTFVRSGSILNYLNENFSVVEWIRAANMVYAVKDVRVEIKPANHEMAQNLQLNMGDPVLEVERTRLANGKSVAYTLDRFPGTIVSDINAIKNETSKGSLYGLLRDRFQIVVSCGIAHITCLEATPELSQKLNLEVGTPIMNLKQIDFTAEEKPVVYTMDYYVTGVFDFVIFRKGAGIHR